MKLATVDEIPHLAAPPSLTVRAPAPARELKPALQALEELVLLAGTLRLTPLSAAIERPVYELPASEDCTILDLWCRSAQILAQRMGRELRLRVLTGSDRLFPSQPQARDRLTLRFEPDRRAFRGTGGALRDALLSASGDAAIIVAAAAQLLVEPLEDLAVALAGAEADLSLVAHRDGQPASLLLARAEALALLPPTGFVDLKEQALSRIARSCDVRVVVRSGPCGVIVRTLGDYIAALRSYHKSQRVGVPVQDDPIERGCPEFHIIEHGAKVHSTAQLYDSVVLDSGCVEAGAVVVRSVVCPGGHVSRDAVVVDRLVTRRSPLKSRRLWFW